MYSSRMLLRVVIKLILTVCVISTTAYTGYELYTVFTSRSVYADRLMGTLEEEARSFATVLDQRLKTVLATAQIIVQKLTAKETAEEITTTLKDTLVNSNIVYGIGVLYNPSYTEHKALYAPYMYKEKENSKLVMLNNYYDYTTRSWYQEALQSNVPVWSDSLSDVAQGKRIVRLSIPFFAYDSAIKAHVPNGIVVVDVLADVFNQEACRTAFKSSVDSYALIVGKSGILIAHPNDNYLEQKKTINDLALITGHNEWRTIAQEMQNRQSGSLQFKAVVAHEPVPNTGWSVAAVYPHRVQHSSKLQLYYHMLLAGISFLAMCLCIMLLCTFSFGIPALTWISIALFSTICCLGIFCLLLLNFNNSLRPTITHKHDETVLRDKDALERFLFLHKQAHSVGQEQPYGWPTLEDSVSTVALGIAVTNLALTKAGEVTLVGMLWQKIPKVLFDTLPKSDKDKLLVTIANADSVALEQAYSNQVGNFIVQGWRLKAVIKPAFDNTKYPLDNHTIQLKFQAANPALEIMFVPDFDAFTTFCKHKRAYLGRNVKIPEWTICDAYFSSMFTDLSHNFGLEHDKRSVLPDLFFNVELRRNFVYPLISGLLPLVMVCSLLFVLLIIIAPETSGFTLLGSLSSLLFSLLVAHQRIQTMIPPTSKFIYLEHFYFIMYGFVFIVSVIAFLHAAHFIRKVRFAQLLYWPILFLAFFILTLVVFWP